MNKFTDFIDELVDRVDDFIDPVVPMGVAIIVGIGCLLVLMF